ncbi:MAG: chromate resistance protein [Geminicoccaceae bacterium]
MRCDAIRLRGGLLEPSGRALQLRCHGRGVRPRERAAAAPCDHCQGADTGRPDLAPEAAGLLAASLGLSRMHSDDLAQLEAGMVLYDTFYRWCRDATDETHNWPQHKAPA